jgi:hypothetical protein
VRTLRLGKQSSVPFQPEKHIQGVLASRDCDMPKGPDGLARGQHKLNRTIGLDIDVPPEEAASHVILRPETEEKGDDDLESKTNISQD